MRLCMMCCGRPPPQRPSSLDHRALQLGDGDFLQTFLMGEADDEAVLPAGVREPLPPALAAAGNALPSEAVGGSVGHDPDQAIGSNNVSNPCSKPTLHHSIIVSIIVSLRRHRCRAQLHCPASSGSAAVSSAGPVARWLARTLMSGLKVRISESSTHCAPVTSF